MSEGVMEAMVEVISEGVRREKARSSWERDEEGVRERERKTR